MRYISTGVFALGMIVAGGWGAGPANAADIGAFTKSCSGSAALSAIFTPKAGDRTQSDMDTLCKCIADARGAESHCRDQLDAADGQRRRHHDRRTRDAYNSDDATQEMAMTAMNACLYEHRRCQGLRRLKAVGARPRRGDRDDSKGFGSVGHDGVGGWRPIGSGRRHATFGAALPFRRSVVPHRKEPFDAGRPRRKRHG